MTKRNRRRSFYACFGHLDALFFTGGPTKTLWSGLVAPVNSVWEHLKLLFFPGLIFLEIELFYPLKNSRNQFVYPNRSVWFYPFGFFAYTGIIGKHFLLIDIAIFIGAVLLTNRLKYRIFDQKRSIRAGLLLSQSWLCLF